MAESVILQPGTETRLLQGSIPSKTVAANSSANIFSYVNPRNAFSDLYIGSIPTGKKLIGAVFLWANNSTLLAPDTYVDGEGTLTLNLRNYTNSSVTISAVRLLTFWK